MLDKENLETKMKRIEQINKGNNMQVFLLHFAGGSCYSFEFLKPFLQPFFDFYPLELPGRGKRIMEEMVDTKAHARDSYIQQIKALRNPSMPYIVYGHSMGATLGLSVVKEMENLNDSPIKLVVSGNPGPLCSEIDVNFKAQKRYLLGYKEFKEELIKLGGIPDDVLENKELYDYFEPILRKDFEILERDYSFEKNIKIETPIHAVMGSKEEKNNLINNWKNYTEGPFESKIMDGNHFFIYNHAESLAKFITT